MSARTVSLAWLFVLALVLANPSFGAPVLAAGSCTFSIEGARMTLDGDCTTDVTVVIPDGFTLNGDSHTIGAVDPQGGHFIGAVVRNGGTWAAVEDLTIAAGGLGNVCDGGADRLRGILFEGASGMIEENSILSLNQGPSGCQEGNAIEVRNAPFDGTHPATKTVAISENVVLNYQKTGIVANGDVNVTVTKNRVGASATQANLAANSIQLGFGAMGTVTKNRIEGNSWQTDPFWAATAILVYAGGDGVSVTKNRIGGNSDVGIYFFADDGLVAKNRLNDVGPDGAFDIGIGNYGTGNLVTKNTVCGFKTPYDGPIEAKNRVCEADDDDLDDGASARAATASVSPTE